MRYQVTEEINSEKQFIDEKGKRWSYITTNQYRQLPENEKRICGDLRKKDSNSTERILYTKEQEIGLYPYKVAPKWNEKVIGYIRVDTEDSTTEAPVCCVRILQISWLKALLIPAIIVFIIAGIIAGISWYVNKDNIPGLDETTVAYQPAGVENKDPSKISIPGIGTITAKENNPHVEQTLLNPKGNQCYFIFRLVLSDTKEVLYESGMVKPGYAVMEFDMKRGLSSGIYDVILEIETRDINNYESQLNGGNINIKLEVN